MPRKKTTDEKIDELARMVNRGFDGVATKHDLGTLATKEQLQLVSDNVDIARADIHDIKLTLGPLVRHVAAMENMLHDHHKRIERLERKVGISK